MTLALLAPAAAGAATVFYVGDSLGVGTTPLLRQQLSGTTVRGDSRQSRPSPEGLGVLRAGLVAGDEVVVFDLGTNDDPASPGLLGGDLEAAGKAAGNRCMVVATINRPPLNGVGPAGLNQVIRNFADGRPGTEVVDWHARAEATPSLLSVDHVHPTPIGYAERAKLFARAVRGCVSGGSSGSDTGRVKPPRAKVPRAAPSGPAVDLSGFASLSGRSTASGWVTAAVQTVRDGLNALRASALGPQPEPVLGG